jgi:hypothetical protein
VEFKKFLKELHFFFSYEVEIKKFLKELHFFFSYEVEIKKFLKELHFFFSYEVEIKKFLKELYFFFSYEVKITYGLIYNPRGSPLVIFLASNNTLLVILYHQCFYFHKIIIKIYLFF